MTQPSSPGKYQITLKDARGTVFGEHNKIYQYFFNNEAYAPLSYKLITFTTLIEEKTEGFVGRQFVMDEVSRFLARETSGYFIIKGEAGIGKSALMAQLVKTGGYVHHFVVRTQGINRVDQFLENVCAQLISKYKLERPPFLPPEAGRDSAFLSALLQEVSSKIPAGKHAAILVDGLDEVNEPGWSGANILFLPPLLPPRVFFVVSMRHKESVSLHVERSQVLYLDPASSDNQNDILAYIRQYAARPSIQARLQGWNTPREDFVNSMLTKSEGNFMYLHHVLPAVERGEFRYGTLAELPQGLREYYNRHWNQIRAIDEDRWVTYRQPVICYLATAMEPVTVWQIAEWSKIEPARVLAAIRDWREFLDEETSGDTRRYRIYHASFQDFLADKDEAREINLRQTHSTVADEMMAQWARAKAGLAPQSPAPVPQVDYVRGLQRLQVLIDQQAQALRPDFFALEARMLENLNAEARYGPSEQYRSARMQAVDALNALAQRAGLASSYNQLCR